MLNIRRTRPRLDGYFWLIVIPVWIALIAQWMLQDGAWWQKCSMKSIEYCESGFLMVYTLGSWMFMVAYERSVSNAVNDKYIAFAVGAIGAWVAWAMGMYASTGIMLGLMYWCVALGARTWHCSSDKRKRYFASVEGLRAIFFLSGASALIYQVVWQRRLINFFGANSESVAVIVAVFMGGLGIGGAFGEVLLRYFSKHALRIFCILELGIALCGALSIPLLDAGGRWFSQIPQGWSLVGAVSSLLLLPTVLMGATLPILVEALRPRVPHMHENVGRLYAINALGSGIAAILTVMVLFVFMGQKMVTVLAAGINTVTAVLAYLAGLSSESSERIVLEEKKPVTRDIRQETLRFPAWPWLALLAGLTGFLSLGQEILLIKQLNWITGGFPQIFGLAVGSFLIGLAYGSWQQSKLAADQLAQEAQRHWIWLGSMMLCIPFLVPKMVWFLGISAEACILGVLLACGYWGARTFPMISGLMRFKDQIYFGRVLTANIIGCVLGSLILGNYAADHIKLSELIALVGLASLGIAISFVGLDCYVHSAPWQKIIRANRKWWIMPIAGIALWPWLSDRWLEDMVRGTAPMPRFIWSKETKTGIAGMVRNFKGEYIIIGGGLYDGKLNIHPWPDINMVTRAYRLLGLHNHPEEVLEVGLSSGSWARAISLDPRVKSLTSVEINPAYLELIKKSSIVSPILYDPKVKIEIDDARRWLRVHPDRRFDLIVSNISFHWRSGATLITSLEFIELIKAHLKPGGMLLINSTYSENIVATVYRSFRYVILVNNNVIASDTPMDLSDEGTRRRLANHPEFLQATPGQWSDWFKKWPIKPVDAMPPGSQVITDDQMTDEFKRRHPAKEW